jgi:ADP-ribose pyrophosphatase YjhB (NUDIX family)
MDIIQQAEFCPKCSSKELKKENRNFSCSRCGFLFYVNSAAATGIILHQGNSILFVRRNNEPCIGMLDLPGGFIDPGETLEEGAIREIKEELSIHLQPEDLQYLCSFPNTYHYKNTTYYTQDVFFKAALPNQNWKADPVEIAGVELLDLKSVKLEDIAFPSHRRALQVFKKN